MSLLCTECDLSCADTVRDNAVTEGVDSMGVASGHTCCSGELSMLHGPHSPETPHLQMLMQHLTEWLTQEMTQVLTHSMMQEMVVQWLQRSQCWRLHHSWEDR